MTMPMTDPIAATALFLAGHTEWVRHRQFAGEFLADVDACVRIIHGIARGPSEERYLGPCGARVDEYANQRILLTRECVGDVYARLGAEAGQCRECGAKHDVAARKAWLDDVVRGHAFRASEIAKAYKINVNTIRSWAQRGQLVSHGYDQQERPLYNIGDVLDLAAADAARRATNQARRTRRKGTAA